MTVKLSRLVILALGALLLPAAGHNALAANNIEAFVDFDGDGFDDNESDVNKDGVSDLIVPVVQPTILASADDLFGDGTVSASAEPAKKTNAQRFALRKFSTRAICVSRAGLKAGFPDDKGTGTAAGAEACPGGNCGI